MLISDRKESYPEMRTPLMMGEIKCAALSKKDDAGGRHEL